MSTSDAPESGTSGDAATPVVEVFWRPGCVFCQLLRAELRIRSVDAEWRNIWKDLEARQIVRDANNGNETVPTVRVGDRTVTNPHWRQLAPLLGRDPKQRRRGPLSRPFGRG